LSLAERDRRWALTRKEMESRGLDCLVLWGWPAVWDFCTANARYLSPIGGNSEFNILVFPLRGEPTSYVMMPTFVDGWRAAQDWVADVRPRRGTWADSVVDRLKEIGLIKGRIGMDGLAGPLDPDGWLPHSVFTRLRELAPDAEFINLGDMMELLRTVKSSEELDLLERAARLGDLMLATCRDTARPGVKESEVYGRMMETMLANGGEEPTLFLWACDALPYPHPFRLPTMRSMARGDVIICEIHPKIGGYYTHVERTFGLGAARPEQHRIYEGCLLAYDEGMKNFAPGLSISAALDHVRDVIHAEGLDMCETGIHGHGLASLEYPRYRHHALKADQAALQKLGDSFKPGMVFAFNIDLIDPKFHEGKTGCVFAETVVITDTGARRLHDYPTEFQTLAV
jgi:Xaa-Pro dipeptidase